MRYVCLGYRQDAAWIGMTAGERAALLAESAAYEERLRAQGHCVARQAVALAPGAMTLTFEGGRVSIDAAAIAERGGHALHDVIVLEARDLNSAIRLMSQLPSMRPGGRLEIRPVDDNP
jgi:hypothetical protein